MKIIFAAGGTAGHINPALAAANYIRETVDEAEILFIGTADHMEARLAPALILKQSKFPALGVPFRLRLLSII